jgi:hypothetical protein
MVAGRGAGRRPKDPWYRWANTPGIARRVRQRVPIAAAGLSVPLPQASISAEAGLAELAATRRQMCPGRRRSNFLSGCQNSVGRTWPEASYFTSKLRAKHERRAMLDTDQHLLAAEYLIGTFYPTDDTTPSAMSHDQATALATAHALLAIAGLLREISTSLSTTG